MGRVLSATLTMRSLPNTGSAAVYTLGKNDVVSILDANAALNWYKVKFASFVGYCMVSSGTAAYIEIAGDAAQPSGTPAATAGPVTLNPVTAKANVANTLTMRKTPSTTGASAGQIPKNATFTVLQVCSTTTWLKISYSGKTGYVLAKYAAISGGTTYRAVTVTVASVNVRSGAGTGFSILGAAKSGNTFVAYPTKVSSSTGTWYKVIYGAYTGYIDIRYARMSKN
jgi:uncharacterized protein YgiM (DUF1202 family)